MLGLGLGLRRAGAPAGIVLDSDAAAIVAAMSPAPDATRQGHINTLVLALKAADAWATELSVLYISAAHAQGSGLLNWKSPGGTAAITSGSPTFTTDKGFTGNGTSAFVNTQIAWNAIAGLTQNNQHIGCYGSFGADNAPLVGLASGNYVTITRSAGTLSTRLGSTTATTADTIDNNPHHILVSRAAAGSAARYVDGVAVTAAADTSSTISSAVLYGLRQATVYGTSNTSLRALHAGPAMNATKAAAVAAAIIAYMTAIGANT